MTCLYFYKISPTGTSHSGGRRVATLWNVWSGNVRLRKIRQSAGESAGRKGGQKRTSPMDLK